jgi:hypothetical protein
MMILGGVTFMVFGFAFVRAGGVFLGVGLLLIGGCALIFALIFLWRGGRLGAEIQQDTLVVRSYFRRCDTNIPLAGLLRACRGACDDATVLEFPDRQFILDDIYFRDSEARDSILRSLQSYAKRDFA